MSRVSKFIEGSARRFRDRLAGRPIAADFRRDPFDAQRLLAAGTPVRTVFDVGGNKGQSAVAYRRRFPDATIYSFEPDPDNFRLLSRRVAGDPKVVPVEAALADSCGTREFVLTGHSTMHSLLEPAGGGAERRITVKALTLDAFAAERHITTVDVLKMDVQGGEKFVLAGATGLLARGAIGMIYTELLFSPQYVGQPFGHELIAALHAYGYRPFAFYGLRYGRGHELKHGNGLFVSPAVLARQLERHAA